MAAIGPLNAMTRTVPITFLICALASFVCLTASAQGYRHSYSGTGPILGAHIAPNGGTSKESDVVAFQTACGGCLSAESLYPGFDAWSKYATRWKWDVANHLQPMIVWNSRTGNEGTVCGSMYVAMYSDVLASKWDSVIDADAAVARAISAPVVIALYPEPANTLSEICANPAQDPNLYIQTARYIIARFAADGVTNVQWMFALNDVEWDEDLEATWYWGSDVVSIVGIDAYNATNSPEQFPAAYCTDAAALNKPIWIKETGALSGAQATWYSSIATNCPQAQEVFAFDAHGNAPYVYSLDTQGFAALVALH